MRVRTTEQAWEYLTDYLNVNEETLKIVTAINGYNLETLEDVLYAVSGYRSFEQMENE